MGKGGLDLGGSDLFAMMGMKRVDLTQDIETDKKKAADARAAAEEVARKKEEAAAKAAARAAASVGGVDLSFQPASNNTVRLILTVRPVEVA